MGARKLGRRLLQRSRKRKQCLDQTDGGRDTENNQIWDRVWRWSLQKTLSSRSSYSIAVSIRPATVTAWNELVWFTSQATVLLLLTWSIKCPLLSYHVLPHQSGENMLPASLTWLTVLDPSMCALSLCFSSDYYFSFPMMLVDLLSKRTLLTPSLCYPGSTGYVVLRHYPMTAHSPRVPEVVGATELWESVWYGYL